MEAAGKGLLKAGLTGRLRDANIRLNQVQTDVLISSTALELWTHLNEIPELVAADTALNSAKEEQQRIEALIRRLERGLAALDNL